MTRIKNWLLVGTMLPAITLAQGGFAAPSVQAFPQIAQAPAPAEGEPGQQPQRPRPPGQPRPPGERPPGAGQPPSGRPAPSGAPPAIQRPAPPAIPHAAPPAPVQPPAPQPRAEPPALRPAQPAPAPRAEPPAARPIPVPAQPALPPRPTAPVTAPAPVAPRPAPQAAPPVPAPAPQQAPVPPAGRAPAAVPAPQAAPVAPRPPVPPAPQAAPPAPAQVAPQPVPVPPVNRAPGVAPAPQAAPPPPAAPIPVAPPPVNRAPGQPPAGQPGPGQTQLAPPPGQPPLPGQPPAPDRQGRRGGIGLGGAAAIGLGAAAIGGIMATQGAPDRLDEIRGRREERREGDVTIVREPGRTIIRDDDGRAIIRRDETERFRELGYQPRVDRRDGETRTVFERPDGTRVVTVTDEEGRLIRRTRLDRDGREIVIIDNTLRDRPGRFADEVVILPPPPLPMPRERYIVDADQADERLIYETIIAPPIGPIPRRYTLDEVRYSPDLRARMRSVDIDTVTFESGSWVIDARQAQRLEIIAQSIRQALQRSPNEVFLVEGHTDAVGSDIDNLSLSDRRAQSVAEILTRDFGVPAENLTTQGYGEQYLKIPTQEAARENRRVTLRRITPLLSGQSG